MRKLKLFLKKTFEKVFFPFRFRPQSASADCAPKQKNFPSIFSISRPPNFFKKEKEKFCFGSPVSFSKELDIGSDYFDFFLHKNNNISAMIGWRGGVMFTNTIEKVVAIIPPAGGSSFTGQSIPPLGMVRILNYVKKSFPNVELELWDGVQMSMLAILEKVKTLEKGTLVAISAHTSYNYRNCLAVLDVIPKDVKVIMGGLHIYETHLGRLAVEKRSFHAIQGPGELALPQYIEYLEGNRNIFEVKNLMYMQN